MQTDEWQCLRDFLTGTCKYLVKSEKGRKKSNNEASKSVAKSSS